LNIDASLKQTELKDILPFAIGDVNETGIVYRGSTVCRVYQINHTTGVLFYPVLEDCFSVNQVSSARFRGVTVDALWELGIITKRFT
jgi:hypothetical protein